uniref:ATPase 8 n=1 Tax=Terrisswalkerius montislewisi TaxID=169916 RepID=Q94VP3_9ANNE|nr:ATPase 8 [Terrisswalkerius montislewisi]
MPHLSPMSWLMGIVTTWTIMMIFTSNIWWSNQHFFNTDSNKQGKKSETQWQWILQDGW